MSSRELNFALVTVVSNAGAQGDSWPNKENIPPCDNRREEKRDPVHLLCGGDAAAARHANTTFLLPACNYRAYYVWVLFKEKAFVGANSPFLKSASPSNQ